MITIRIGDKTCDLTRENSVAFTYTETPWINHIYVHEGDASSHFIIFNCTNLVDAFIGEGYPLCLDVRPTTQDMEAYWRYLISNPGAHDDFIGHAMDELERELGC